MKDLVQDLAARNPHEVAVIDRSGSHTVGDLLDTSQELASRITAVSGPGATVLLQADNTWRTVAGALAVGRLDGTLALINRHSTRQEFEAACEDIVPDAVVAAPDVFTAWDAGARNGDPVGVLDGWWGAGSAPGPAGRWGDGVVIGLTSASTGRAKGVVQSEAALRYAGKSTGEAIGLEKGDSVGALVPLSSAAAICFGMYLPLMLGGRMLLLDRWNPADAVTLLAEYGARWTMCVPTMALQMSSAAPEAGLLHAMIAMTVGGGPMDSGALGRAERRLDTRFLRVFGMSECLGHTTSRPTDPEETRLATDGTPFPGTVLRAVDETGATLPDGMVGQAQVRGPSLFVGYARDGGVAAPDLTSDGFLATGDLIEVHDGGTVSVRGREKDIIIRGGRNIDITEVETSIACHPQVDQVCVVPVPDDVLGERVAALVVTPAADLGLTELQEHLTREGLAKGKWPEFVFRVDAFPQNRAGKLSRRDATDLAQRLRDSQAPTDVIGNDQPGGART